MSQEPTNAEILKAITEGQKHTDGRIDEILEVVNDFSSKMDKDISSLKSDVGTLKSDVGTLKSDVGTLKSDVGYLKSNMVTKDDLERSQAKQKGEIILTMRKEDIKLRELISTMHGKQMLTDTEVQHIITMEPFAQLSV